MARVNYEQAEQMNTGGDSSWLSLKDDGDSAAVKFMYDGMDDLDIFTAHKVTVDGKDRWVDCIREYDDPIDACPFCASGMKTNVTMMLAMVDVDTKEIKIWQRGKNFIKKLQGLTNRYAPLSKKAFEIVRNGKARDMKTTYEIYPLDEEVDVNVEDFEKPNFLGTVILNKSSQEMDQYLATGKFPQVEKEEEPRGRTTRNVQEDGAGSGRRTATSDAPTGRRRR